MVSVALLSFEDPCFIRSSLAQSGFETNIPASPLWTSNTLRNHHKCATAVWFIVTLSLEFFVFGISSFFCCFLPLSSSIADSVDHSTLFIWSQPWTECRKWNIIALKCSTLTSWILENCVYMDVIANTGGWRIQVALKKGSVQNPPWWNRPPLFKGTQRFDTQ